MNEVSRLLQVSLREPIHSGIDDAGLKEIISAAVRREILGCHLLYELYSYFSMRSTFFSVCQVLNLQRQF
jgi:hypothetical protein